ncbi:reverse transcriptase domain-containing protein [Tanacetum coccineum]
MVCPDKVEAVLNMPSPKCLKDVQKLNGKQAILNRLLSKSAEKSLSFFKTLKKCTKKSDFQWTTKAKAAFKEMKKLITLFTDGSSYIDGSGAGLILTYPEGPEFTYALRFRFDTTNNEAEYKALIAGLRIAEQIGVKYLQENMDSRFVANQVLVKELKEKSINETEVLAVVKEEGDTWMTPIYNYLTEETLLAKKEKARIVRRKSGSMHAGTRSVVAKAIWTGYYWPTMHADARKLIRACDDIK